MKWNNIEFGLLTTQNLCRIQSSDLVKAFDGWLKGNGILFTSSFVFICFEEKKCSYIKRPWLNYIWFPSLWRNFMSICYNQYMAASKQQIISFIEFFKTVQVVSPGELEVLVVPTLCIDNVLCAYRAPRLGSFIMVKWISLKHRAF